MDFKYKSRMGKTWKTDGLMNYIRRNYPGAQTLTEALAQEIAIRNEQVILKPKEESPLICPETVTQNRPREF